MGEHTELGADRVKISRIGFGGCPMGGHGWGEVQDAELLDAIAFALDHGINFFDTADVYGLGRSEALLAEGLRGRRDRAVIATKFGVRIENGKTSFDNSVGWLRTALDASLRRLKTDYIDLYQLHYWDGLTDFDDIAAALDDAAARGKIRAWGVTNVAVKDMGATSHVGPSSFSYQFSLADRGHEDEILQTVQEPGPTFLAWGSLGQGILTGKYSASHTFDESDRRSRPTYVNFSDDGRRRNLKIVEAMRSVQRSEPSRSLAQIALRWILDRVPGSVALVGIKRIAQIEDAIGALGWRLAGAHMDALDAVSRPPAAVLQSDRRHDEQPGTQTLV